MTGLVVLGTNHYLGGQLQRIAELRHQDDEVIAVDWASTLERNSNVMLTNGFDAKVMRDFNARISVAEIEKATGFNRVSVNSEERSEEIAVKACLTAGPGSIKPDAIIVCQNYSDSRACENSSVGLRLQNEFKIKNFVFGIMDQEAAAGVRAIELAGALVADGTASEVLICGVQKIVQPFPRILTNHTVLGDGAASCWLSNAKTIGWCVDFTELGSIDFLENPWFVFSKDVDVNLMADAISGFVNSKLSVHGLTPDTFDLTLRSGLNGVLDKELCSRLGCGDKASAFPSESGYLGSADVPMMLDKLHKLFPNPTIGKTCLLVATGFGGRIGLVALTYRQNIPIEQSQTPEIPLYFHGSGYYVPNPPTTLADWGKRNSVDKSTIEKAEENGVKIFRDSRDTKVYNLVSNAVSDVFQRSGVAPTDINLVLVAHTSSFPIIPGPGDIVRQLCVEHGMTQADGFSVGQQNCVSIVSAIRIAMHLLRQKNTIETVLIASGDQIRSEIDLFRLLGTNAVQSDGGSAIILSRKLSDTRLESVYNFSDTANWLGRIDAVESNRSYYLFNVRLIRRLLKDAKLNPERVAVCLPPNINRDAWPHILKASQIDPELIDNRLFNSVGHVFGSDWIISLTENDTSGVILCLSYGLCDCFGGVLLNRVVAEG
ncbi:MAG: hypothetical protein COC24_017510 [Alphaproteobacteria bacterium]|nr:hypothetical protein [Alphaproteobacteria bacterium]